jgi:putative PIN family toxin of toxin-antitoxin system
MSLRVVFDTNVIVSGLLNKKSVPRFAFRLAKAKGTILQSEPTLEELATVLKRKKFDRYFSKDDRISFLLDLLKFVEYLEPTVTITACRDEKDNKFLELAVSGEATHIVTGDDDLLTLHPFQGIDILTPAAFLELNISDDEEN